MKKEQLDLSITLGEYAHHVFRQNFQRFTDQETDVLQDSDPEPLHQMRVGMRRLRTAIQVFGVALRLPDNVDSASIGKIAKSLGKTRDLDVLKQDLETRYQPYLTKQEHAKIDKAFKQLHKVRGKQFRTLKETIHGDRYRALKRSIEDWLEQPRYQMLAALPIVQILPDLLLPLVCQLFLHPGWLVGTTIQDSVVTLVPLNHVDELNQQMERIGPILHDLRKRVKEVRYQTEFFSPFYEQSYEQWTEELKTMQDRLGELQDQAVERQFLESVLRSDLETVLPTVKAMMEQNQTLFWQMWQPIQQRYLSLEQRQSLRSLLMNPLSFASRH